MQALNRTAIGAVAAFLLTTVLGTLLVHGQGKETWKLSASASKPCAGDYPCLKSRLSFSPVQGPAGPLIIVQYDPSVIGTIVLDGKGGYQAFKKTGHYAFDSASRKFSFVSGPLQGWPVVYEVSGGTPMLRLAPTKDGTVTAKTRTGEHVCRFKGDAKFPDSPPPGDAGGKPGGGTGPGAPTNGGARGTLTFRESWGSDSIVDVNLATGEVRSRFEGRDACRGAGGETAFVNRSGALVIAGADGRAITTIPVTEKEGRPDLPVLSPDGGRIAFHIQPVYYDSRVVVATRDGKRLAEFKDVTEPDWTPDGRLVMAKGMTTVKSKPGLYISDADLSKLTRIDPDLDNARWPSVSPNGKTVAFVHHGHIWLMNLDGTGLKQLTVSDKGEERPAWSPDGERLAAAQKEYGTVLLISVKDGKIIKMVNRENRPMQSQGRLTWR
jgi:WD40 repeat protein